MSNVIEIDDRQLAVIDWYVDQEFTALTINIDGLLIDTNYTLNVNSGEFIYQVGSGLVISGKDLVWTIDTTLLGSGHHTGVLSSESNIAGTRLKINLNIYVT